MVVPSRYTIGESHSGRAMESYLRADLGDDELGRYAGCPKVCVISAAVNVWPPQVRAPVIWVYRAAFTIVSDREGTCSRDIVT